MTAEHLQCSCSDRGADFEIVYNTKELKLKVSYVARLVGTILGNTSLTIKSIHIILGSHGDI